MLGIHPSDPSDPAADHLVLDQWVTSEGPAGCAHHDLRGLDLGSDLVGDDEVIGRLTFGDRPLPGSNDTFVQADDRLTLSCLRERLNRLGEGIEVRVWAG